MNKKITYIVFVLSFTCFVGYVIFKSSKKPDFTFIERIEGQSPSAEWLNTRAAIQNLLTEINLNPKNDKAKLKLAFAYIDESRVSGNHVYYDAAALNLIDEILNDQPKNFDALCAKATVLLSQHHFTDAKELGNELVTINPYSAFSYGILTDAYVELGNYEQAIKMADKMVSIRPDIRSYSRISYLREITGDYPGAIDAMKMAVASGIKGMEQTEWARYNLGKLYEKTGDLNNAKMTYSLSDYYRPDYCYALAGLGSVAHIEGYFPDAIQYYNKAQSKNLDYAFSFALYQLYKENNQPDKAEQAFSTCEKLLGANTKSDKQNFHGHYADRELAEIYTANGNYEAALNHALLEYNRRPDNIDINKTLAWIYYKQNNFEKANSYINIALSTNSKNAELLYQAALIKKQCNENNMSMNLFNEALSVNKNCSVDLQNEINKQGCFVKLLSLK